jgi:peptidylprolyl isomerase
MWQNVNSLLIKIWGRKVFSRKTAGIFTTLIYNAYFQRIYMNIIKQITHHFALPAFFFLAMSGGSMLAQANDEMSAVSGVSNTEMVAASGVSASVPKEQVYALVNGTPITYYDFNAEYLVTLKSRFYHGRASEEKMAAVRKELTDTMIERVLAVQDAERRGIKPDEKRIDRIIANLDRRGKLKGPNRDRLISQIRDIEGKKSQFYKLEKLLTNIPLPTQDQVKAYYDQHLDLFTEPEKLRLSVILISVDPSAPVNAWAEALEKARGVYNQIKSGADFAELARKVSGDKSAANGGDLGYLHHGMLPRGLEDKVDKFKVGEVVEPIKMLEGMAVFRLEDRIPPRVIPFDRAKARAEDLLVRDEKKRAWDENMDRLRKAAKIEIFQQKPAE